MPHRCAFLTLEDRTGFCIYDHLLHEPLARRGWAVEEIPWNRPGVEWERFDAVVIRSTWDYQQAPERFLATLEQIEAVTRLDNPLDVCQWNLDKRYLCDLEEKGARIVPTHWVSAMSGGAIGSVFRETGAEKLVAKPLIGANADDTFVLRSGEPASWQGALRVFEGRAAMVQPFVESIHTEGETSLFYFGGAYSHAVVKRPAEGDYRVQEEHGGSIRTLDPDEDLHRAGRKALGALPRTLLYARVDLVRLGSGEPAVIEMELIEPSLYFEQVPGSAELFAEQFVRMLRA